VHGTFGNMIASWNYLSPALRVQGYCVWALDYGYNGTGDIRKSARQLSTFVDKVLSTTGASKVSIVGHSQGGMMPRYYVKFLGGSSKVDDLIGLAPSTHGTTSPFAVPAGFFGCTACAQQAAGSSFMTELNTGDETPAPVSYTVVATRYDQVVTPYTSQALPANSRVTNIMLQAKCRLDFVEHVGIIYDPNAVAWVKNALGRSGPADPGYRPPTCV
jgi:triacylglycerol lipase